jgi:ParB/RepB/Spo0J family partition protein
MSSKDFQASFVEGLRTRDVQQVPLEWIDLSDKTFQYRFSTNLGDLRISLLHEGQREPIDLTGTRPHRIIDGFRRVEAVRSLGWSTVMAFVHKGVSDEEAHKLAFLKNVVRKNLSPMDKAHAIFQARQRGRTAREIAQDFGISEKQVRRYEGLLKLPSEIQRLLNREKFPVSHAKYLSDFKLKDKDLDHWVREIEEKDLTAKQLKRGLKQAFGKKAPGRGRLYMKRERNAIRMYPFRISKDAPEAEKEKVVRLLQDAIEVLSS